MAPNVNDVSSNAVSVAVQADVLDDLSGWNWGYLQFVSPTGGSYTASFRQISGTPLNGTVGGSASIPRYAPAGSYTYDLVLSDYAGNTRVYHYADLVAAGYSQLLTINFPSDTLGPTVSSLDVQPKVIDSRFSSNVVTVSATMSDDLSGWAWGYLQFVSPTGSSFVASLKPTGTPSGLTVALQGSVTIPQHAPFGSYSYDLVAMDAAGNTRVYHKSDLVAMGYDDLLTVQAIPGPSTAVLLWQDLQTGQLAIWLMEGVTQIGDQDLRTVPDTNWRLVGNADFTANGKPDLLWEHLGTGDIYVWVMDGATFLRDQKLATVPDTAWRIGGIGPFGS